MLNVFPPAVILVCILHLRGGGTTEDCFSFMLCEFIVALNYLVNKISLISPELDVV